MLSQQDSLVAASTFGPLGQRCSSEDWRQSAYQYTRVADADAYIDSDTTGVPSGYPPQYSPRIEIAFQSISLIDDPAPRDEEWGTFGYGGQVSRVSHDPMADSQEGTQTMSRADREWHPSRNSPPDLSEYEMQPACIEGNANQHAQKNRTIASGKGKHVITGGQNLETVPFDELFSLGPPKLDLDEMKCGSQEHGILEENPYVSEVDCKGNSARQAIPKQGLLMPQIFTGRR